MSERAIVNDPDKMAAWMRAMDDRVTALQQRKLQGDLVMTKATISETAIDTLGRTVQVVDGPNGLQWTDQIEALGSLTGTYGNSGVSVPSAPYARVMRENGRIIDIRPAPQCNLGGTVTSITSATLGVPTIGPVLLCNGWDAATWFNGTVLTIPVTGVYSITLAGQWAALADATERFGSIQFSPDRGTTWIHLAPSSFANYNQAADFPAHVCAAQARLAAGYMLRAACVQRSVGALNYTVTRFDVVWVNGQCV